VVDIKKIDVTMSTIAVLTIPPQQPVSIDQKDLERVLTRPLSVVQSPAALVISSQRDQIEAIVAGNKTNIRDLSGRKIFSRNKIPSVLNFFIQKYKLQVTSYGINFIVTVPCRKPAKWIVDNLLSSQISERTGKTLVGGVSTISVASEQKTWNIKFEPIDDERISVDFNASEQTQQLPGVARLRTELQEQFDGLLTFLNNLEL
jgi:hypothetical protein